MEKYFNINRSGFSVRCKIYCSDLKSVRQVVIFGHGFSGHKDNKAAQKMAEKILKRHRDAAVIVFNWPCHGDDARSKLTLSDCMTYLGLVTDHARTQFRTDRLYGCATSFGGYLFLKYISENGDPFRKTVLRCPAVNMYEVLTDRIMDADALTAIQKGKPALLGFDRKVKVTADFLSELKGSRIVERDFSAFADRMMIIHGTADEIVDFDTVSAFAADNGIAFVPSQGTDHRFSDPLKMDDAIGRMIAYYDFE